MDELKNKIEIEQYEALLNGNFRTLLSLFASDDKDIQKHTNLKLDTINEIKLLASKLLFEGKITTAFNTPEWDRISTGCENIDSILRGGVPINGVTEISGCSGVGKTQVCLQLALMVQMPVALGGKEKETLYFCTEDIFPSKRFHELAQSFIKKHNIADKNLEDHVYIEHVADFKQLHKILEDKVPTFLLHHNVGIIILDSVAGVFRSENENVSYITRSQEFVTLSTALKNISEKYDCAVVCTNQVTENLYTNETEPCLGLAWSNNITCRFSITRLENTPVRTFKVVFAPDLKPSSREFLITSEGVINV